MKYYLIDETDLAAIRALSKRLYTENRMDGGLMRDHAQRLRLIHESAIEYSDLLPKETRVEELS